MKSTTAGIARAIIYDVPGPHDPPGPAPHDMSCGGARPWPVGCGEASSTWRASSGQEAWERQADAVALSISGALDRIAIPMARAAAGLVRHQCWFEFGFARLEDYARERFGRSGRWVREMAALGEALDRLPALEAALGGEDGGAPLGLVAAMLIGRVASADSVAAWVGLARRVTVRELKNSVREARANGSVWPPGASAGVQGTPVLREPPVDSASSLSRDDDTHAELVRLLVPQPVKAAFDEAFDLFRANEGHEATVTSFIEALVAEAASGPAGIDETPDVQRSPIVPGDTNAVTETALCHSTNRWEHLPARSASSWALALAGASLRRFEALSAGAGSGTAVELGSQMRELLALEDGLQRRLGDLLLEMSRSGAWHRLQFDGCAHYAEQRLGLSRSAASERLHAAGSLRQLPLVWRAYEAGEIGLEPALHILRMVHGPGRAVDGGAGAGAGSADFEAIQQRWLALARNASVKRMRDEARLVAREVSAGWGSSASQGPSGPGEPCNPREAGVPGRRGGLRSPSDDASWQSSLRREPGMARARVARWSHIVAQAVVAGGRDATSVPDVFLRLRLPSEVAADFLAAITASRRHLERQVATVAWDEPWLVVDGAVPTGSLRVARDCFVRCRRAPAWVGLLGLIEAFVDTWDSGKRVRGDDVYVRDGYRCSAPGCTSRRHLEDHHIIYRSRGGGDELSNRTCVCRFHHQRGEHGGLASCRGRAPLGIVWRLGRDGIGGEFCNEKKLDYGAGSAARGGKR